MPRTRACACWVRPQPIFAIVASIFDSTVVKYFKTHSRFADDTAPNKQRTATTTTATANRAAGGTAASTS